MHRLIISPIPCHICPRPSISDTMLDSGRQAATAVKVDSLLVALSLSLSNYDDGRKRCVDRRDGMVVGKAGASTAGAPRRRHDRALVAEAALLCTPRRWC